MSRISPLPLRLLLLGTLIVVAPACGKRGPPLPPLHLVPDRVANVQIVRRDQDVTIRFTTPTRNMDGSEPLVFDRIEIFAMTVKAGGRAPTYKQLVSPANKIAELGHDEVLAQQKKIETAVDETAATPIPLSFTEKVPVVIAPPAPVAPAGAIPASSSAPALTTPPLAVAGATPVAVPQPLPQGIDVATRFYMIVPYANHTRVGNVSDWMLMPLGALPLPPQAADAKYDEQTLTMTWKTGAPGQTFNVYEEGSDKALNAAPLTAAEFTRPAVFGQRVCFTVRGVRASGPILFESAPSNLSCTTLTDTFPPPAPSGLIAFTTEGSISLTWDAVTAADLAGYIVLRGEGEGATLQPLMTMPLAATSFSDTTVKSGVHYTYAVVAVDNAKPGNRSKESNRVDETGR